MAGAFITPIINGDEEFTDYLNRISHKSGNARPAFEIAGQVILNSVRKNFEEQGRPERWKELSRATLIASAGKKIRKKNGMLRKAAKKRIANKMKSILINRGMAGGLMGSIHYQASNNEVSTGSPKIYAAIHNNGGKAGRNKSVDIDKREYLLIQDEDWGDISEGFVRFLITK